MKTVVIPDIHGDFDEMCSILHREGIIKSKDSGYLVDLIKKSSYSDLNLKDIKLIQLGDILDSKNRKPGVDYIKYSDMLCFIFFCNIKKTFPNNVVLILGNHEYLNYNDVFNYVSMYSTRTKKEISYIKHCIERFFVYFHIDEYGYLYIHASIPTDAVTINSLKRYETMLKTRSYAKNEVINLYERVFNRIVPSESALDLLGVEKVFMGHTPHEKVTVIKDRIFYVDTFISRCFLADNNEYQYLTINAQGVVNIKTITRNK